ncbi:hypothetical protein [Sphingomonas sp. ID0503]|uniref:hypothetical protein n=1 Tax=Sphingomonas sp. ID0503 TaxID=3399691 RepID=UPI003AFA8B71
MADEAKMLARLDAWLAQQAAPTRNDAFATGDREIAAGFVLRQAREADAGLTAEELAEALVLMAESMSRELKLSEDETRRMFGIDAGASLAQLRSKAVTAWPLTVLKRIIWMMETVRLAVTLLSDVDRGYAWFHRANTAEILRASSALSHILDSEEGLEQVRGYLQAELWG